MVHLHGQILLWVFAKWWNESSRTSPEAVCLSPNFGGVSSKGCTIPIQSAKTARTSFTLLARLGNENCNRDHCHRQSKAVFGAVAHSVVHSFVTRWIHVVVQRERTCVIAEAQKLHYRENSHHESPASKCLAPSVPDNISSPLWSLRSSSYYRLRLFRYYNDSDHCGTVVTLVSLRLLVRYWDHVVVMVSLLMLLLLLWRHCCCCCCGGGVVFDIAKKGWNLWLGDVAWGLSPWARQSRHAVGNLPNNNEATTTCSFLSI